MGIPIFKKSSFSSYDRKQPVYDPPTPLIKPTPPPPPNPDPSKFEIVSTFSNKNFLILEVQYPGCTNYEGRKILVYEVDDEWTLLFKNKGTLDPHFSDNPNFYSPIARFEPSVRGWKMAKCFIKAYSKLL